MTAASDKDVLPDQEEGLAHPRDCARFVGHVAAEETLARALRSGAMPGAWLIGGPKGLGKATLAYRFARWLLDGEMPAAGLDMDLSRPVARMVSAQAHPGLIVLKRPFDDKGERLRKAIPIDEVRKIRSHFGLSGQARGYRVCIVDTADALSEEAANALLKTIEEPPPRAVFLILANAPMRLLPTIRSRCRRLTLKPLSAAEMDAVLEPGADMLSDGDRQLVAALSGGVPGRALALARGEGLSLYRETIALLADLPKVDFAGLHDFAGRLGAAKSEQSYALARELFAGLIGRLVRFEARQTHPFAVPGEDKVLARLAQRAGLERWLDAWDKIRVLEARADALALDRKQVVLSKFTALTRVAAGADSGL